MNPNNDYLITTGFSTNTPLVTSFDDNRTPIANILSNPYPNGINQPAGAGLGAATFVGRNTTGSIRTLRHHTCTSSRSVSSGK